METVKWLHRTDPVIYGPIQSVNKFCIQKAGQKRLAILFPGLDKPYCSGGPNTILRFAAEVAARGINVVCLSLQVPAFSPEAFQEHLVDDLGIPPDAARNMEAYGDNGSLWLNRGDRVMATASWTFPLAKDLARRCGHAAPAYFIQDLEPLFLGLGLGHAWLMKTYHERFLPIINSPTLARALFNVGNGSFATPEFRDAALVFTPAIDRAVFHPGEPLEGKKRIFIYARLNEQESRNMPELALEAVNRMCWEGLIDPGEWDLRCYGSPDAPPFMMRNGLLTTMLPPLSLAEYAEELRKAALGLCFVLSPHPGYMAFELAASGVPVITNTYLTKTADEMSAISPLIHAVFPDYDSVTARLRRILLERTYRGGENGPETSRINLPASWEAAFAPLLPRFMDWFAGE